MTIQFDTLFDIEIMNSFYTSGISEDFIIEPTTLCKKQLKRFGLLFKETKKGAKVVYEFVRDNEKNQHPFKTIEKDIAFSFTLKSRSQYLLNYTDLPLDGKINEIFYLHNLNNNQQGNILLLSAEVLTDSVTTKDRVILEPHVFQYKFESANVSAEVEIFDIVNASIVKETVQVLREHDSAENGFVNYRVNLRNAPPGKYTLHIDGEEKLTFYADDTLIGNNIFAIIDVFKNEIVPPVYRFTDANHDVQKKIYTVKLNKRQTFWKYFIIIKYQLKDLNPEKNQADWPSHWPGEWSIISTSDPSIEMNPDMLNIKTFSDGTVAVPFISNQPLSLQQKPLKEIQLVKKTGGGSSTELRPIIEGLPNPSCRMLSTQNGTVFSETFIYI